MMRMRWSLAHAILLLAAPGVVGAQVVDPNSYLVHFVPVLPNVTASVWCGAYMSPSCGFAGYLNEFPNHDYEASLDAGGWIYPALNIREDMGTCSVGGNTYTIRQYVIKRIAPTREIDVVGYLRDFCDPGVSFRGVGAVTGFSGIGTQVDPYNGLLYLHFEMGGTNFNPPPSAILQVRGLASLLDILLSYQPPSTLTFNVPVRPEGLPGADSFSVYSGDVTTAANPSQAVPLECTVPAGRAPVPGEHLTVADPLPDPAAGDARYYLAAVNYQGQRRAGRSAIGGFVQGRNAAALPTCK